jgi:hypothetical protein
MICAIVAGREGYPMGPNRFVLFGFWAGAFYRSNSVMADIENMRKVSKNTLTLPVKEVK